MPWIRVEMRSITLQTGYNLWLISRMSFSGMAILFVFKNGGSAKWANAKSPTYMVALYASVVMGTLFPFSWVPTNLFITCGYPGICLLDRTSSQL